jgi:hypothetical protein
VETLWTLHKVKGLYQQFDSLYKMGKFLDRNDKSVLKKKYKIWVSTASKGSNYLKLFPTKDSSDLDGFPGKSYQHLRN